MLYQSHHYHLPPHNIPASFWLKFKIQHVSFLSRGPAPSSPLSFCQSFLRVFLHPAESGVFSKVRVCEAQRSNESPSGLLSDRTVLRSKMEGPRPDKFTLTRHGFCGNLSQQFNIYIFYLFAQYLRGWAASLFDFSSRCITDWQDLPKKRRHDRSVLWRLFCCRFVRCTLKIA